MATEDEQQTPPHQQAEFPLMTVEECQQQPTPQQSLDKGLIDSLARLPEKALMDESRLAAALHVTSRTVRRMVARLELPPPVQLGGRSVWMCGRVLAHIESALEQAERESLKELKRINRLTS